MNVYSLMNHYGYKHNNMPDDQVDQDKALAARPSFSIRLRIILAFLLIFCFSVGITIGSIIFISRLNAKFEFFTYAENFASTVQEARRYEKNFFLYGSKSDLYDALGSIHSASSLLAGAPDEIRSIVKQTDFKLLTEDLRNYEHLLNQLTTKFSAPGPQKNSRDAELENLLRLHGHRILSLASDLVNRERQKVSTATRSYMLTAIFLMGINFLAMIWVVTELTRQILQPLGRAVKYTQRFAAGDFTPITPQRKYRDEFSDLAIAINHMMNDVKEKQEQLVQSRKMAAVGTLTSGIAHELNNPLNNISLTTEALIDGMGEYSEEQKHRMLQEIFTQVERASGTVRNLLDFTRTEYRLEPINIQGLIQASLKLVNNELQINNIEVETDFAPDLANVRGNYHDLQQVFLNLFLNSIQAMSNGGKLSISVRFDNAKYLRIDVKDTGCGIPKESLDRIFEPFFTTKEVGKGTGLGLSVIYGVIEKIGGHIKVDSELGQWTIFSVYLPVE
jgi:two-component system NtrC family sensor kinase